MARPDACRLFAELLYLALAGADKETLLTGSDPDIVTEPAIRVMATGSYRQKTVAQIRGSGYVVDSLEAALWCFAQTDSYEAAVLAAANLGDDADTTWPLSVGKSPSLLRPAWYSQRWLVPLTLRQEITTLADQLQQH